MALAKAQQTEEKSNSKFSDENLNPLSAKGRLAFSSFGLSLAAIVVFNLIVWIAIRSQLIPARMTLDRDRTLALYIIWFFFALLGFAAISNTFIKRWAYVLGDRNLSKFWRSLIRFSLLSPLLAYPLTLVTFLFLPRGPLLDVSDGGSRRVILSVLITALLLSVGASALLSSSLFGIERIDFRGSIDRLVPEQPALIGFPGPRVLKPILATATPGLRYLFWMGADIYRSRLLSISIGTRGSSLCAERMGYLGLEVQDCYFANLRKLANVAPLVSPYFALYYESLYRQEVAANFKSELDLQMADRREKLAADPTYVSGDGSTLRKGFIHSLLMLSNQVELLEPSQMFVERTHFLNPGALLHAYGSPEFPMVEAGQDIQRVGLLHKLMPIFEFQLTSIRKLLEEQGRALGAEEITVGAEVRDLQTRIDAIKRNPL